MEFVYLFLYFYSIKNKLTTYILNITSVSGVIQCNLLEFTCISARYETIREQLSFSSLN